MGGGSSEVGGVCKGVRDVPRPEKLVHAIRACHTACSFQGFQAFAEAQGLSSALAAEGVFRDERARRAKR